MTEIFPPPMEVIPHRPPFLFIDRVLSCTPEKIIAERTFLADEPFFAGHFPGMPIVPGVLLLEGLAQTMAYAVLLESRGARVLLTGLERARFRQSVVPGDTVTFEITPERTLMNVTTASGVVRLGTRVAATATVKGYLGG